MARSVTSIELLIVEFALLLLCLIRFFFFVINEALGLAEGLHMLAFFPIELLFELKFHLAYVNAGVEYTGLVRLEHVVELLKTTIAAEGLGLHFVLVGLLVE